MYEVGRIFRNEGMDPKHNPEFTTVELYQAYADFHDMMDIAEGIYTTFAKEVMGSYELEWMGEKIDLTPGWPMPPRRHGATPCMPVSTRRSRSIWCSPPSSPCTRWRSPL